MQLQPAAEAQTHATQNQSANRFNGLRLSTKIMLVTSTLTLTFLLIVGAATYYAARAQIVRSELDVLDSHAALIAGKVSFMLGSVVSTLEPLANNTLIINSLMDSLIRETSLVP